MASYSTLIRKITTAEINRIQREGGYTRWAYFVDEYTNKVGMIFANDDTFGAYTVADEPDPKLTEFGRERIGELVLTLDPELLAVSAGGNELQATIFSDPFVVQEDEFLSGLDYALAQDWQQFLQAHGVRLAEDPRQRRTKRLVLGSIIVLIIFFVLVALKG
jgi:hypothetical protein